MVKIIHIASWKGLGGGATVVFNIIKELQNKFNFLIITPVGLYLERYSRMGVKVIELKKEALIQPIKEVRKIISKETPDVVHIHGTRAAFWTRLAIVGLKKRPKIIYTLHGFHIIRRNLFLKWPLLFLERILNRWTDILVCVSEADKNLVLKYKTISSQKIRVIKNGIDIKKFQIEQREIQKTKTKLGLKDKFIISSIGRLHPQKNFSTVLRALKLIISKIQNVKLLIVGDGPLRGDLEKEVKDLKIENYVKFLGFRQDIPVLIGLSDIVVLSTNWEGLPLVPLEVGAARKPIVASDVGGVRETIIDGKTGLLFEPGSPKDLTDKILKLYRDKNLREEIGERGFEFISEKFSKDRMIKEYQGLYGSIL